MMKCMQDWAIRHGLLYQPPLPMQIERVHPPEVEFDDEPEWCDTCDNLGVVNCLCGGDICVCRNNGEKECPDCA